MIPSAIGDILIEPLKFQNVSWRSGTRDNRAEFVDGHVEIHTIGPQPQVINITGQVNIATENDKARVLHSLLPMRGTDQEITFTPNILFPIPSEIYQVTAIEMETSDFVDDRELQANVGQTINYRIRLTYVSEVPDEGVVGEQQ